MKGSRYYVRFVDYETRAPLPWSRWVDAVITSGLQRVAPVDHPLALDGKVSQSVHVDLEHKETLKNEDLIGIGLNRF